MKLLNMAVSRWWSFILLWLIVTIILASSFYLLLNYKFYYTGASWQINSEASIINNAIRAYLNAYEANDNENTITYITNLIATDKSFIAVTKEKNGKIEWKLSNDKSVDTSRTIVENKYYIEKDGCLYTIDIRRGNRPRFYTQLARAWSFSLKDYLKNKENYINNKLHYRTLPLLYGLILTAICVWSIMLLFRKNYYDNKILVDNLSAENGKLQIEISKIMRNKEKWENQLKYLTDEKYKFEEQIKEKDQEIHQLQGNIDKAGDTIVQLEILINGKCSEISDLTTEIEKQEHKLRNVLRESPSMVGDIKEKIEGLTKLLEEKKSENQLLAVKCNDLEKIKTAYISQISDLASKKDDATKAYERVSERLNCAQSQIESLTTENEKLKLRNDEISSTLHKLTKIDAKNAKIVFFNSGKIYSMAEIHSKLGLNDFLKDKKVSYYRYSDRYFYPKHSLTFSELLTGIWLSDKSIIYLTVPIDKEKETIKTKKQTLENALKRTRISNVIKNMIIDVQSIDKKNFLHMRKLEVFAFDGKRINYIFDVGMDFVAPESGKYIARQDNYVVIQEI